MDITRMPESLEQAYDMTVIFDDFNQWAAVLQTIQYNVAAISSGSSLAAQIVGVFPRSARIQAVDIIASSTATISSSNTSTWTLKNGSTQICSTVFNATTAWPSADTLTSLGTVVDGVVQAGGYLVFSVTGASGSITPETGLAITYIDLESLPNGWQAYLPNSGQLTVNAVQGGTVTLAASDPNGTAAASDEGQLYQAYATLQPTAGYPMYLEAYVQYAEVNTNQAGVFFGISSNFGSSGFFTADAAGLKSTGTTIGLYKIAGQTNWSVIAQNNSTTYSQQTTIATGGSAYQQLSIELLDDLSGYMGVVMKVDGQLVRVANFPQIPWKELIALASDSNCTLGFCVKNGATVTNGGESLTIDFVGAAETRIAGTDG